MSPKSSPTKRNGRKAPSPTIKGNLNKAKAKAKAKPTTHERAAKKGRQSALISITIGPATPPLVRRLFASPKAPESKQLIRTKKAQAKAAAAKAMATAAHATSSMSSDSTARLPDMESPLRPFPTLPPSFAGPARMKAGGDIKGSTPAFMSMPTMSRDAPASVKVPNVARATATSPAASTIAAPPVSGSSSGRKDIPTTTAATTTTVTGPTAATTTPLLLMLLLFIVIVVGAVVAAVVVAKLLSG